jgi:hypothetical protein
MTFHGNIIFPEGAGGNHLRWLLFLDPQYKDPFNNYVTPKLKAKFITEHVYGAGRTWNTWLQREWHHRPMLDSQMNINHNFNDWARLTDQRTLFLLFLDYELPLQHYFHMNLSLNSTTPDQLREKFAQRHSMTQHIQQEHCKNFGFVYGDSVFDPVLDPDFYQQLVEFFGFSNLYVHAAQVHQAYYQCRVQSAQDFCKYFTSTEFHKYLNKLQQLSNQ